MKPFLQHLAEEIATRYGDDPGQLCVVLPNRRAGVFLKKYLATELKRTSWSPRVFSIEDFITYISGLQIIDPAGLLFEFYQVHKTIHGTDAQDFEAFADWAQVLLRDFDEVDQYLVDPEKIFTYLNAARAITVWNLEGQALTEQEKHYIEFYNSFLVYYRNLRKQLLVKKTVYKGLAYRVAEEKITQGAELPWKKVFFCRIERLVHRRGKNHHPSPAAG